MSTPHAPPPHHHLTPSTPIPASLALSNLKSYLHLSKSHAYLHPDVTFTSSGATASAPLDLGGLVMHQLRRVEAGLEGKVMEIEMADLERMRSRSATPGREWERGLPEGDDSRLDRLIAETGAGSGAPVGGDTEAGFRADEEVQGNYQEQLREKGVRDEQGEVGERSNVVGNVERIPKVQASNGKKRAYKEDGIMDKASKKRIKKMRIQEEKARRQSERMAGRELEVLDEKKATGHVDTQGEQDVDMTIEDTGDNRDQTEYQGDEVPQQPRGKPWPDTPDVYRADVPNSALNGEDKDQDIVRSGVDGKPQKKDKKKKKRKSGIAGADGEGKPLVGSGADGDVPAPENDENQLTKEDKMDIDTELARDSAQKVSKVERMVGRTPVKDNGVAEDVEPATSPVPGSKEDDEAGTKKTKRQEKREKKKEKRRKSEAATEE